jgi:phage/plasmid-associated DNA primase
VQPSSSRGLVDELGDLSSPVRAWVRQCCDADSSNEGRWLVCEDAYKAFSDWSQTNGHKHVVTFTMFGTQLKAATGTIRKQVTRGYTRPYVYARLAMRLL